MVYKEEIKHHLRKWDRSQINGEIRVVQLQKKAPDKSSNKKNQSSVYVLQQTEEKKILRADARMYIYKIWTTKKWLVKSVLCVKNKLPIKPYILFSSWQIERLKKVKTPIRDRERNKFCFSMAQQGDAATLQYFFAY